MVHGAGMSLIDARILVPPHVSVADLRALSTVLLPRGVV